MNTQKPTVRPLRPTRRTGWNAAAFGAALIMATGTATAGPATAGSAAPSTATSAPPTAKVPGLLQAALDRLVADGVPGVIAFQRQGSRAYRATSGVRELATGKPVRADDRFRIGSITKSFVSTVILQLVGEHRLRLSDTVERWLPNTLPSGSSITVRQLLNHTSGLYDYTEDPRLLEPYADQAGYYWAPRDLLALANSHPPLFMPGSNWSYSNTNYVLLGLIIEAVTGHRASAEVRHRIIAPLHLRDTTFPLRTPHIAGRHTHGYFTNLPPESGVPGGVLDTTTLSPSHAWTAGGMISTVSDLSRFHQALFTGRLLPPAQQRELKSVVPGFDYGMGVSRWDTACGKAWGHGGSFPGYYSLSLTSPDGSRQAVIALNSNQILSEQTYTDLDTTLETAFCGQAPARGHKPKIRAFDR
jgi:D-alanyl-D-alanine carboxypeptidase